MCKQRIGTAAKDLTEEDLQRIAAAYHVGVTKEFEQTGVWKDKPTAGEQFLLDRVTRQVEENKQRNAEKDVD
ncbi:yippee-like protein [Sporosarcina cascadiensis]|uniref:hypothetical protein n=1 Tax=Sporosarcina cascadiensis TaxID=2660747 RepID=UPI00129BD932|nr:hypothetical protein [Sporosarcina cascadiensis]